MPWEKLDWEALDRLRAAFLAGGPASVPYWRSEGDLAAYDLTYGERIGWKWDAVLRELRLRGWEPEPGGTILDWGCGSGIAGRRVVACFGPSRFSALRLRDHSPLAAGFAAAAAARAFPGLEVGTLATAGVPADEPLGLLVISHVLNELTPVALDALRTLIGRARSVIWVEPGTHEVSRRLGTIRGEVQPAFSVVAPCTHQGRCPMPEAGNERHWCHHFAPPPGDIFADPNWVRFGRRAGIDLRSLPYCFLALDRRPAPPAPGLSRVIGRPEPFKPYLRLLNCDSTGLAQLTLARRADPALCRQLERTRAPLLYRWHREGATILAGGALDSPPSV